MANHLFFLLLLSMCMVLSWATVLFNPFNPFARKQQTTRSPMGFAINPFAILQQQQQRQTTRAPIPIALNPFFYNIAGMTSSTTTNYGQTSTTATTTATTTETTTETTTQTTTPTTTTMVTTTLPPNFCLRSSDCPIGSCCRDLNNQVIVMSEVFSVIGPFGTRTHRNGTCTPTLAQLGEQCNDFCGCEAGMVCFRDVNKPCCPPAVCQYKAALEKTKALWMRCFEDDKCEVFEDDSSSEEDSDEITNNSTTAITKKFRVPHHLVPTVRTILKQQTEDDESDESDEVVLAKLFNDSLIQNITNAILLADDSDEDSSSEETAITILLQGILNDLLNKTQPSQRTTTPSPTSTTESLIQMLFTSNKNSLMNTKTVNINRFVDLKQQQNKMFNSRQQISNVHVNNLGANTMLKHAASMGQQRAKQQMTTLDPLTAMIAQSIASQLNIQQPPTAPIMPMPDLMNFMAPPALALPPNQSYQPDMTFLASGVGPNGKLAPKLKRLQMLMAKQKSKAAMPFLPSPQTTTTVSPLAPNMLPQNPPNSHIMQLLQGLGGPANAQTTTANPMEFLLMQQMFQQPTTTANPLSMLSKVNAAKAVQAMELLKILKRKRAQRKLRKSKRQNIISFNKKIVNRLSTKSVKTRKALKQLQALRLSKARNSTLLAIKLRSRNGTKFEDSSDSDESEEFVRIINGTIVSRNKTEEDDDSDDSDEEITLLLTQILAELGTTPKTTRPTTTTATTTTTASPTTTTQTTTTTQSTTTATTPTTTTTATTAVTSTTPMNLLMKNILLHNQMTKTRLAKQKQLQNLLLQNQIFGQNTLLQNQVIGQNSLLNNMVGGQNTLLQNNVNNVLGQKTLLQNNALGQNTLLQNNALGQNTLLQNNAGQNTLLQNQGKGQNTLLSNTKQPLDLKSLSWNDVVSFFQTKRAG